MRAVPPPPTHNSQFDAWWRQWIYFLFERVAITTETSNVAITADYSADQISNIFADATGGNITVTLPLPDDDREFFVKKTDVSVNTVTLDAVSVNIDGATTKVLTTQYESVTVYWDKTQWWIK